MSHYTCLVVTDKIDINDEGGVLAEVGRLLAPYNENTEVEPYKSYFDKDDIESAVKHYGSQEAWLANMDDWCGHPGGVDEKGIFSWSTYNPKSKWDWYAIGGRWNGLVRGNFKEILDREASKKKRLEMEKAGASHFELEYESEVYITNEHYDPILARDTYRNNSNIVKDLPEDINAYSIITPDGEWHSKGRMGWFGMSDDANKDNWPHNQLMLLGNYWDKVVVGVDLHI